MSRFKEGIDYKFYKQTIGSVDVYQFHVNEMMLEAICDYYGVKNESSNSVVLSTQFQAPLPIVRMMGPWDVGYETVNDKNFPYAVFGVNGDYRFGNKNTYVSINAYKGTTTAIRTIVKQMLDEVQ